PLLPFPPKPINLILLHSHRIISSSTTMGVEKTLTDFLTEYYSDQLQSIILSSDNRLHYPLYVDFAEVMEYDAPLAHDILFEPTEYLPVFDNAAKLAQNIVYEQVRKTWEHESVKEGVDCPPPSIKEFVHVRIEIRGPMLDNPEFCPSIGRVRVKHRGILLTLKGTVIRSGAVKMIEGEREYECRKCKHRFKVHPELESRNSIPKPMFCPSK
ncbi:hypothetical protein M8C21_025484, partial [Ambrosia artemisiifolia]